MAIRRCPQCHTTSDDKYGFCIKCGYEFQKLEDMKKVCVLCGYENPDEADFCVKCGTPLVLKTKENGDPNTMNPIVIKNEMINRRREYEDSPKTSSLIIILGYIFSILGGILGFIIAIYLITRKDPATKKHGQIQLGILIFYLLLILMLYLTGNIPNEAFTQFQNYMNANITNR